MRAPVVPLEEDWRDSIDQVARARGWATTDEPARVAPQLARLSATYNDPEADPRAARESMAARLVFSFARDVPKGAGAVRELVATGALAMPVDRPLRVLDLGAGLGASTWGVVRALEASGGRGEVDAVWVDEDREALEVGRLLARAREGRGAITLRARAEAGTSASAYRAQAPFDVVLLGQVLSEMDRGRGDARVAAHAALLRDLLHRAVGEHGSLVVVEPALRDRTRHLHAVRDALVREVGVTLFAPCLHAAACPALAEPGDWCHEDLPVDLPPWLVPLARAAGLRWQGLTFSYLVLRNDGQTLAGAAGGKGAGLRVVSSLLRSKGKKEAYLCGEVMEDGARAARRVRARRLDRDEAPGNAAWDELSRGDLVAVDPPLDARHPRVGKDARVVVVDGAGTLRG